jgi:hypothetical protein
VNAEGKGLATTRSGDRQEEDRKGTTAERSGVIPVERRGQVTRVLTNDRQLETGGTEWLERKVQPSLSGTSRVTGDGQARSCEGLGMKFPGPTPPGLGDETNDRDRISLLPEVQVQFSLWRQLN